MRVLYLNLLWCRDTPLYLEWAPENILSPTSAPVDEEEKNEVGERIVTKANIEQTVEGVSAEDIDPDRVEV
jgi:multiple RNA-binding domain-containing protein 1